MASRRGETLANEEGSAARMSVHFEPATGGGTSVTLSGAVASAALPLAGDPGPWAEPLAVSQS